MKYHTLEAPAVIDVQTFEKNYFKEIGLIPEIISRYRSTYFLHIAGGYDSGYYSYIWAAVYDNDAFEAFKEKGIFDKTVAASYRKNILEKNGTMDAMQMYLNFRGREPVIEPLLKTGAFCRTGTKMHLAYLLKSLLPGSSGKPYQVSLRSPVKCRVY